MEGLENLRRLSDNSGTFSRIFRTDELAGAEKAFSPHASIFGNLDSGAARGMRFQNAPHAEQKTVRLIQGE